MDLSSALRSIRKAWYFVALGILAAVSVAVLMNSTTLPVYESSATYVVTPSQDPNIDITESVRTLEDPRSRAIVSTYAEVLASDAIKEEAATTLGLDLAGLEEYAVRSVVLPEANVVELTVTGPSPQIIVLLSTTAGALAADRFVELYQLFDIVLLDPAVIPTTPANPTLMQTAVMAAALGLLGGTVLALMWGAPKVRKQGKMRHRVDTYGDRASDANVTPLGLHRGRASGAG
jgi:capsular polysaccharide biosynthesis protein